MRRARAARVDLSPEQVLRSLNIVFDADQPSRVAHFVPTAKSAKLMAELLRSDRSGAHIVVAPYGSGKSLAATFFLQAVENVESAAPVLREIGRRFQRVDRGVSAALSERLEPDQKTLFRAHGIVIALSGFQVDLPAALSVGLAASLTRIGMDAEAEKVRSRACRSMDEAISLLAHIRDTLCAEPVDRLCVVWDEFGRHLEEIVSRGSAASLNDIQLLAEFAARTRKVPITMALLLHQGLMRYASNSSLTVQQEWRKIEGRFDTVQFVDDSRELYELVAQIVQRYVSKEVPDEKALVDALKACRKTGLFADVSDDGELSVLLGNAFPLDPVGLYLLPRVSSRVAQNERTLFTFLYSIRTSTTIGPPEVFDYFSDAMRSDTTPGGTYRPWLETQSALTKVDADAHVRLLKCACLLSLGLTGERSRVAPELLAFAATGYGKRTAARKAIDELVASHLLLHRRNTDSVSVWHGTDIDLRGRLDQQKARLGPTFDAVQFLDREVPLGIWKPIEHNVQFFLERYFETRYLSARVLLADPPAALATDPGGRRADGIVFIVVPETDDDIRDTGACMAKNPVEDQCTLVAVPRRSERLFDVALEVHALQGLAQDSALLSEDPLVEPELRQMIDDAQGYLTSVLDRLFTPSPEGPTFYHRGRAVELRSRRELRSFLSQIMTEVYPRTPRINNEMIVRRRARPVIVNARKKLVLGILERSGSVELGLEGNRPDMSMLRTVLQHTGLYRADQGAVWRYAGPEELSDPGMVEVWSLFQRFLTSPSPEPKSFAELFGKVQAPPYGVRDGLFPILLAAALRAFPSAATIMDKDGHYVPDLLPTTIEDICAFPALYSILVVALTREQLEYLEQVYGVFAPEGGISVNEREPLRRCYDAIVKWRSQLPLAAAGSRKLSPEAQTLLRLVDTEANPYKLLLRTLPESRGGPAGTLKALVQRIRECRTELEGAVHAYYDAAGRSLTAAIGLNGHRASGLRDVVGQWAGYFGSEQIAAIGDGVARGFLSRAQMQHSTAEALVDSICSLVVGKPVARWDDSTVVAFDRDVHAIVARIEDTALSGPGSTGAAAGVRQLAAARLGNLYSRVRHMLGEVEAREILRQIAEAEPSREER